MKHENPVWKAAADTVKNNAVLSLGLLIAIAGTIVTAILPPLVLEKIVDTLAAGAPVLWHVVCIYVLMLAVAGIFDAAKESLITIFGQKVTHALRSRMCEKLSRLPASYFSQNEPGVISSRFVNDVDAVDSLFSSGIISMVVDACKVLSILAVIFVKSRGLGALMILVTPLLYALTRVFQKKMLKAQIDNRRAVGHANNHVPETIRSIRMIHTFHKEKYMEDRYDGFLQESYRAMEKSNFYDAVYSPIIITTSAVIVAVMMILSARGGSVQSFFGMSAGTAVAVIAYVGKVFEPLESIGMEIQNIQSAVAGVTRINEFLQSKERVMPKESAGAKEGRAAGAALPAIELSGVCFGYEKGRQILRECSFCVQQGESVTLTGRTGAGKSTVFKLLLGLYVPDSGSVRVFGKAAERIADDEKRKLFGYVEQTFHMIPGTVQDQITLRDKSITEEAVEGALRMVGMAEGVKALEKGLDTACTPELFSQGQLQLLSIARAVAADPEILLLDEITANLDSDTEKRVMEALAAAAKGRTVVSISHRLYETKGGRRIEIGGGSAGPDGFDPEIVT